MSFPHKSHSLFLFPFEIKHLSKSQNFWYFSQGTNKRVSSLNTRGQKHTSVFTFPQSPPRTLMWIPTLLWSLSWMVLFNYVTKKEFHIEFFERCSKYLKSTPSSNLSLLSEESKFSSLPKIEYLKYFEKCMLQRLQNKSYWSS